MRFLGLSARAFGTNRGYVEIAKRIKENYPEKFKEIYEGKKTISKVKKELEKEMQHEKIEGFVLVGKNKKSKRIYAESPYPLESISGTFWKTKHDFMNWTNPYYVEYWVHFIKDFHAGPTSVHVASDPDNRGNFLILDGNHRYEASKKAGLKEINLIIWTQLNDYWDKVIFYMDTNYWWIRPGRSFPALQDEWEMYEEDLPEMPENLKKAPETVIVEMKYGKGYWVPKWLCIKEEEKKKELEELKAWDKENPHLRGKGARWEKRKELEAKYSGWEEHKNIWGQYLVIYWSEPLKLDILC